MHVLTVLDHPNPSSLSAAVARRFNEGAQAAGHSVELADLHAEGFDPRWSMADIEGDRTGGTTPPDVLAEQARIEKADAVSIIKIGRHLGRVKRLVEFAGLTGCAGYIERVGLDTQKIMPLADVPGDAAPYFSMILIYKGAENWIKNLSMPMETN